MSAKKLSVNKACLFLGLILLLAVLATIIILYDLTHSISAILSIPARRSDQYSPT